MEKYNPSSPETTQSTKASVLKKIAATGLAASLAFGLTGCGEKGEPVEAKPEPAVSITVEPAPSQSESLNPEETEDTPTRWIDTVPDNILIQKVSPREPLPSELEKYAEESTGSFFQRPFRERYLYVSYLQQNKDEYQQYYNYWASGGKDTEPHDPISPDSSAEDILHEYLMLLNMASSASIDGSLETTTDYVHGDGSRSDFYSCNGPLDDQQEARRRTGKSNAAGTYDILIAGNMYNPLDVAGENYEDMQKFKKKYDDKAEMLTNGERVALCPGALVVDSMEYTITNSTREQVSFKDLNRNETETVTAVTIDYTQINYADAKNDYQFTQTFYILPVTNWKGESEYTIVSAGEIALN